MLEVMSSPKYLQKRIGYLGAVQSFRPDTEVLMLATNLLKKVRSRVRFLPGWTADRTVGFDGNLCDYDVSANSRSTAHHYVFSSNVGAF